jgi:transcriptional regulator with XRE-family HTH domain
MAAGRRGRPYQVPEDSTSLRSGSVNVDARVGWLLLMSRLHHPDQDLALGEQFNAALRSVGLQADRSAVSRWESGKVTPRYSVLVAYEQALGLRSGQLTSVVNALRRALGGEGLPAWMPILDSRSDGFHERLDALFDALLDGPATGPEWTSMAHHVAATDAMYVHGRVWDALCHRLVNQMARSVGVAYLQRMEAVRLLLEHRVAHPWLLEAVGDYLDDDAVQIINDPMGVLEISPAPVAAEVILERLFTTQSDDVFGAAVDAAAIKIQDDFYGPEQIRKIEQVVLRKLAEPNATAAGLEELISTLPEDSQARLLAGSKGVTGHHELAEVAAHGERFSPDTTRRVSQRIADTIRDQLPASNLYDEDKMTPRLIREGLFAARSNRMHFASIALVGSPFRPYLAAALAGEIEQAGLDDPLAPRFARLLRYVAGPAQEDALLSWVPKAPSQVARDMALTIGHLPSDRPLDELVPLIAGDRSVLDRALLYGLGMRQAAVLANLAEDEGQPDQVRAAARWWMRQGGAVRI